MGAACSLYGGEEKCLLGFVGKPEGKRPLARHRHKSEGSIKIDLQEEGWEMNWTDQAQNRDGWRGRFRKILEIS